LLALLVSLVAGCSDENTITTSTPDADATYRVTFTSTWSATTHPTDFPVNPHFSSLVGGTHCGCVTFWAPGNLATTGIKDMAERGRTNELVSEVEAAQTDSKAEFVLLGGGIAVSPGAVSMDFSVSLEYPRVTLVSMLAPSPDWFVGVAGMPLFSNGDWIDSMTVTLYPYDAGTDSGTSYASANAVTDPPVPVFAITDGPLSVSGTVPSIGTFTFVRQ